MASHPCDWDATTYERVAAPQERWALGVLERLELEGGETVLDAGCGSGRVTRHLVERLPQGKVLAVDASPSMIEGVHEVLRPVDQALVCDLLDLELEEPVDAVFSAATFHWVLDHERLFAKLHAVLRPGGRMEAQCGGEGNVAELRDACRVICSEDPIARYFDGWKEPWLFAGAAETEDRLRAVGFKEAKAWLEEQPTRLPPADAHAFVRTVCLGPHLQRLPPEAHDDFVFAVMGRLDNPTELGYVRLNISARA